MLFRSVLATLVANESAMWQRVCVGGAEHFAGIVISCRVVFSSGIVPRPFRIPMRGFDGQFGILIADRTPAGRQDCLMASGFKNGSVALWRTRSTSDPSAPGGRKEFTTAVGWGGHADRLLCTPFWPDKDAGQEQGRRTNGRNRPSDVDGLRLSWLRHRFSAHPDNSNGRTGLLV